MKFIVAGILVYVMLFSFTGCKKDKDVVVPAPLPVLSVKLSQPYLAAAQVDSAFAIWKTNNQKQRIKMAVRHDSLIAEMSVFNEGNGELTIHIFSNKKYRNQYYGQWILRKTVSLQKTTSVNYNGPSSFADAAWFPRVELADAIGHKVTIALRPDDAYFIIKNPGHAVLKYTVDRSYWKTTGGPQLIGFGTWECTTGCVDVANDEYFRMLPARIGNKQWNHISITIIFQTDPVGGGAMLTLEYEP